MNLSEFKEKITQNAAISFSETIKVITDNYQYTPTEFTNGLNADAVINAAGTNEGSCKIFAFALLNELSESQTLNLFGDYYHKDVLLSPEGTDHANIRTFMKYGWAGISFNGAALSSLT